MIGNLIAKVKLSYNVWYDTIKQGFDFERIKRSKNVFFPSLKMKNISTEPSVIEQKTAKLSRKLFKGITNLINVVTYL